MDLAERCGIKLSGRVKNLCMRSDLQVSFRGQKKLESRPNWSSLGPEQTGKFGDQTPYASNIVW